MGGHSRGFTLLELMVVIVLIGVVMGMVSLALGPSPAREARQQAQDFIRVVQQLRERAVLDGLEYGVRVQPRGYQALRLESLGWTAVSASHRLPESLTFGLEQDGHVLALDDAQGPPQLLMLSSDEISPFRLFVKVAGQTISQVVSDGLAEPLIDG
ncbi:MULTISPECIES: type II secretion system minor pseudopilin GspH [Pseudomonas]|jgi:general secretion pathway protein H|uniref:Type II secretion system protein H n=1 Tax=Pseudomonas bijieensis TaxID=2681983 RepID=A0A6N1CEY1_9PSED|nr:MULTISPECIES: type II secretion system minor pseudopilin GspH [Pseudomonas]QIB05416.1 type II secretion system minor pseudopilin GspH [Pseudomonas fluorescens]MCD9117928.1 type II secretion system minor pseudopilin GspH [Pseudomonas bijieensis]PWJ40482.1 general secretion pathway protein H [Pseudomonas sp. 43mfcvi1.1]QKS83344.1 type II secretion system minor pseudopilin GspH [Pseudomonas bijieensis]UQI31643.1 type II secretion system minor pseudopilin GspH [Pseudomonas bijieensis]